MAGKLIETFISVVEAAKILGCSPVTIEIGLRNKSFPIGCAWHTNGDGRAGQWNFRIPREAFLKAVETGQFNKNEEAV